MVPFSKAHMVPLCIALLAGEAHCHRHLPFDDVSNIGTEESVHQLARRLQAIIDSPLTIDKGINTSNLEWDETWPSNGCTLCQGMTLLEDKIPNQNLFPEFKNATCGQWEDVILPQFYPGGLNCPSYSWYQLLFVPCCQLPLPRYECEQNVHEFHSTQKYNKQVPPIVSQEAPLVVSTELVFDWMDKLVLEEGSASIHVSIELKWKDPRLAWTVDDVKCADYVSVATSYDAGDTSIWIPDFGLLNGVENFRDSPARDAIVSSDGTVRWRTGGMTTATCEFQGLANIPFDTIGCQFLYGHRTRTDANSIYFKFKNLEAIRIRLFDTQYSEYIPVPELFEKGYTDYQNTDYASALYYNLYFRRATNFYVMNIIIPTIIFTYCGFFTFLLDMRIGERLGYSMALALVVVAHQIVTIGMIPISTATLWINKFIAWSFYWVLAALVQSVIVGFIYYLNEDYEAERNNSTAVPIENDVDSSNKPESSPAKEHTCEEKPFYYICSTRKFDYACLAICFISYTIFVISMLITVRQGTGWTKQEEAEWESHDSNFFVVEYEN